MTTAEEVRRALQGVRHPELPNDLVELRMIKDITVSEGQTVITVALPFMNVPVRDDIVARVKAVASALEGAGEVVVELTEMAAPDKRRFMELARQQEQSGGMAEQLNDIRHVVAVMSGKGGVGKSLVASLLAVALRREGHRVGILDADITGPSIPKMFFPDGARPGSSPHGILPAETQTGIKVMSINLLLDREDQAVIWRGPLISGAIKQFWGDVFWGHLDYLVVDLPPGTSDASLTVMQSLPLSGVVLVSSPQGLAGMVVRKAAQMAQQLAIPILGLVENMSYFVCPDSGQRYEIFGPSHSEEMAARLGVPLLGQLPIDPEIARLCDAGEIEGYPAQAFVAVARRLAERMPAGKTKPVGSG
jgi:ATP-binding protein involved in chromosome partitioning